MPLEVGVWSSAIGQCSIYIVELKEKPVNSTKTITFWLTQTSSFLNFFLSIPNGSLWSALSPSKSLKTYPFLDQLFFILVLGWRATMQLLLLIPMKLERYFFRIVFIQIIYFYFSTSDFFFFTILGQSGAFKSTSDRLSLWIVLFQVGKYNCGNPQFRESAPSKVLPHYCSTEQVLIHTWVG